MGESRTLGWAGRRGKAALKSERDERDVRKPLASLRHRKLGRRRVDGLEERAALKLLDPVPLAGVCETS